LPRQVVNADDLPLAADPHATAAIHADHRDSFVASVVNDYQLLRAEFSEGLGLLNGLNGFRFVHRQRTDSDGNRANDDSDYRND
jgi:hypothetical protein